MAQSNDFYDLYVMNPAKLAQRIPLLDLRAVLLQKNKNSLIVYFIAIRTQHASPNAIEIILLLSKHALAMINVIMDVPANMNLITVTQERALL